MRIRSPRKLELEYIQRMMVWMLMRPSRELTQGHAVQLGLGAATITRHCHGVLRMDRVTAVEINPAVVGRSHQRRPEPVPKLRVDKRAAARALPKGGHA